jgi:hypothetical protein
MSTSRSANSDDVRVESVLNGMTLEELAAVQAFRGEAVEVVTLLVGLAVASAWMRRGGTPASTRRLQDAMARVREEHVYMLPIPRDDPCFCGSGSRFRACHGRPPNAAPAVRR